MILSKNTLSEGLTRSNCRTQPFRSSSSWRHCSYVSDEIRHTTPTVDRVPKELGADYILVGSVRRSGSRVRITTQLIEREKEII